MTVISEPRARPGRPKNKDRLPVHSSQNPCFRPGTLEMQAIEAMRDTCYGNGHTSKDLGAVIAEQGLYFRRSGSADSHVRASMNPGRPEFFAPSELMAIMAHTKNLTWLHFQAAVFGFRLVPIDDAEEAEQLRSEIEAADRKAAAAKARLREIGGDGIAPKQHRWRPNHGAKFRRG